MIEQSGDSLIQKVRVRMGHDILSQVEIVQGDTARELHFLFEDYVVPTDAELRIYIRKPSGLEVYNFCSLKDNEIIANLTEQMSAEVGESQGQIQIIKSSDSSDDKKVVTTFPFTLLVVENLVYSSSITSTNEFKVLDELITEARELVPQMRSLIETATSQEAERQKNEAQRKKDEATRTSQEEARVQAEALREQKSQEALQKAQTALENANTAQSTATQLIENVTESLDELQNAAGILQDFGTITEEEINSIFSEVIN